MLLFLVLSLGTFISISNAQAPASTEAVQVTGLAGVKQNTKGSLKIENGSLSFAYSNSSCDVSAVSVGDVVTGSDSQRALRGTVGTLSRFAPYGGGRALSLLRNKLDIITIQYRDPDGGLHGAIFTMPVGKAELIKEALLAQGAHTSIPPEADSSLQSEAKEPVR
jgi:hypothetical protein